MTEFVTVQADDIARAWLDTILAVTALPGQKAFHAVTRIRRVDRDGEQRIHRAASDLLARVDRQPLETVANTIFPAAMARQTPNIDALAARYERVYPQLQRLEQKNRHGTYFHRLIAYPGRDGSVNQLARVISNLNSELSNRSPKRARYETTLEIPGNGSEPIDEGGCAATPVFAAGRDTRTMGFPCLSFLSFQHDKTSLHTVAHYRSQYLLERGLGNYLGIARLQRYLAEQAGLRPGGLTVVVGHAFADHLTKTDIVGLQELRDALNAASPTSVATDQPADAR
jgi:hypothetical protein